MSVSPLLSRKLRESLGQDAGEGLVAWMDNSDTVHDDLDDIKRTIHEMQLSMARLDSKMDTGFSRIEALVERRSSDLMKWSFVFWCGAVAAIAALARVLR